MHKIGKTSRKIAKSGISGGDEFVTKEKQKNGYNKSPDKAIQGKTRQNKVKISTPGTAPEAKNFHIKSAAQIFDILRYICQLMGNRMETVGFVKKWVRSCSDHALSG